ncbi:hypothetical protein TEQG_03102 [Trichophyton equinum CBS 127.97]|uniref:Uncharacterized protein n=1 Tax=Trichophyton equinum (strain ATCC MYA-4606 / CBS 127.97) TaxID=559882 RepID=F2PQA2_TRIEC|nr:hypothetical protein TEQG_03102 [Trichophyton equinum CBS 127.97]
MDDTLAPIKISSPSGDRQHTLSSYTQVMYEHTQRQMEELRASESPPAAGEPKKTEHHDRMKRHNPQENGLPPSIKKHDYALDNAKDGGAICYPRDT